MWRNIPESSEPPFLQVGDIHVVGLEFGLLLGPLARYAAGEFL